MIAIREIDSMTPGETKSSWSPQTLFSFRRNADVLEVASQCSRRAALFFRMNRATNPKSLEVSQSFLRRGLSRGIGSFDSPARWTPISVSTKIVLQTIPGLRGETDTPTHWPKSDSSAWLV